MVFKWVDYIIDLNKQVFANQKNNMEESITSYYSNLNAQDNKDQL